MSEGLEERIYTAKSNVRLLQHLRSIAASFPAAHALGFRFAERNIRSKYRQSLLGIVWAFLPPIATAIIWIVLRKASVVDLGEVGFPYPVFVISGTLIWTIFVASVMSPMQAMNANRGILVKLNFPRESIIISAFYEVLFTTIVALIIIGVALLIYGVTPTWSMLMFIPCILVLIILGMAFGLLVLPFSMIYRDVQFVLPTFLQFLMYLTPVVYAKPIYEGAAKVLSLNPLTPPLSSARLYLLGGIPDVPLWHVAAIGGGGILLLVVGIILQRVATEVLIERMGS